MNETEKSHKLKKLRPVIITAVISAVVAASIVGFLVNIMEKKQEARNPFYRVVDLIDETEDSSLWGKNFPMQYDAYLKTVDQIRTRFGGSEAVPKTPTQADPRSIVAQSRLEADPRLKRMWAGYGFARDFREDRGHAFMLDDQTYTERQIAAKQPGTCLHCHASVYVPYMKLGKGDLIKGFELMNQKPYHEARTLVHHPVGCIDCHSPETMQLRITRPAFLEGIKNLKKTKRIHNYDVNKMATRQEMRSFVCAQCHVEYYFKGPEKRLVYPWSEGTKVENILAHYEKEGFKDWVHQETGAKVLKAQHPEFELWREGIHARSGVSCADCHMPYKREGAMKISDHHVRSPLLNINHSCQTCHKWPESELRERVEQIQSTTFSLRNTAMDALIDLIDDLKTMKDKSKDKAKYSKAQDYQRQAQFFLDFVEAENSTGFHAPQEAARILAQSINYSRKGQILLRKLTGSAK